MLAINATPDELQALLELTRRVPMTRAETLFINGLFNRWAAQVEAQAQPPDPNSDNEKAPAE